MNASPGLARSKIVLLDACGITVKPVDAGDGSQNISLADYRVLVTGPEQAAALIDAIFRIGEEIGWVIQGSPFNRPPRLLAPMTVGALALRTPVDAGGEAQLYD